MAELDVLRSREGGENFPVAMRLLPKDIRGHLHAVYAFARTVDDTGDTLVGDRNAALLALRADLAKIWAREQPQQAAVRGLVQTVRACALEQQPFQDLVEANLMDQRVSRYDTFEDVLGYCRRSANPVGQIVLGIFGCQTPDRVAQSDRVCSALQVLEHCQDVGEDYRSGRIYLPMRDIRQAGIPEDDLGAARATPEVRRLVLGQVDRADELLGSGTPLVAGLHGWAGVCVAGFVAGGLVTARALREADGEVLATAVVPSRPQTAGYALRLLAGRRTR